jgi:rod shape determining protein RodA
MPGSILLLGLAVVILTIMALLFNQYIVITVIGVLLAGFIFFIRRTLRNILSVAAIFVVATLFVLSVDYAFEKVLEDHQKTRINVLLGKQIDLKGAGYNVNQSKIAIGSGGFWGKGFLNGTQTKFNFVPEQSTDFIFCTVGEEWGFVGTFVVVLLYLLLCIRIILLAERQRSEFSRIYGYGVASILFFHFFVNIGMTIGLMPVIGIPLPFFSYGGSSLWAFTLLLFIFIKQDSNRLQLV